MDKLEQLVQWIVKRFAEISGYFLMVIIFLLILDFISRGMFYPIQGVNELAVFVMVAIVYMGLADTEEQRKHISVTVIINRLPQKLRQPLKFIILIIS